MTKHRHEVRKITQGIVLVGIALGIVWLSLYFLWRSLPYLPPGAEIIVNRKIEVLQNVRLWPRKPALRIFVVGNSITLAGFIPEQFDRAVGYGCSSFNLGLPGRSQYVKELKSIITSGNVPTHILIAHPWTDRRKHPWHQQARDDHTMIYRCFPYRNLPRDLAMFLFISPRHGGILNTYRWKQSIVDRVMEDRGYHFISGQSLYKNHRLPEDYTLPTDRPDKPRSRKIHTQGDEFDALRELAETFGIQVLLVPKAHRINYCAPAPDKPQGLEKTAPYEWLHVLGRDYVQFDNSKYSDSVHLNPEGATLYTSELAQLFREWLAQR